MGRLSELVGNDAHFNMACNLINDGAQYAAFKQNQERLALQEIMFDNKTGEQVSFEAFQNEGEKISTIYNKNYLLTEENNARQGAVMARKWATFEENADLYPNLEYRAIMDNDTRDEHAEWHSVVLPINDAWWDSHFPPNGWNCRCDVIQTDKEVKKPLTQDDPNPGWKFNAGKERRLFPSTASYYKTKGKTEVENKAKVLFKNASSRQIRTSFKDKTMELPGIGQTTLTRNDVKNITGKPSKDHGFRNMAVYDIENRLATGKLLNKEGWPDFKTISDPKHKAIESWYHYEIDLPNNNKAYVAVKKYKPEGNKPQVLKIHAITDIKPKRQKK